MNWRRAPLSDEDNRRLDAVKWSAFTRDEAQAIAEGWNAGLDANAMHAQFHRTIGRQSICILIGRLSQLGIVMRRRDQAPTARPVVAPSGIAAPPGVSPEHVRKLRRLAPYDSAARGALERLEREGRA